MEYRFFQPNLKHELLKPVPTSGTWTELLSEYGVNRGLTHDNTISHCEKSYNRDYMSSESFYLLGASF